MKNTGIVLSLWLLLAGAVSAGSLSKAEASALREDITEMVAAFEAGDAALLIERTHPSLPALMGGQETFVQVTQQPMQQLRTVRFVKFELGEPTQTYRAGDEEVCFVPKVSIMEVEGKRAKSTSFMIAIRKLGGARWTYLDGAGVRTKPELLYLLLPALERDIPMPPNQVEVLPEEPAAAG